MPEGMTAVVVIGALVRCTNCYCTLAEHDDDLVCPTTHHRVEVSAPASVEPELLLSGKCRNCGRDYSLHVHSKCPKLDLHVVIDADSLERMRRTGHPWLLANLIAGRRGADATGEKFPLAGVRIERVGVGTEVKVMA